MNKELIVKCNDSCCHLQLERWPNDEEVTGEFYLSAYAAGQRVRWRDRLTLIWAALCGREYRLNEIILSPLAAAQVAAFLRTTSVTGTSGNAVSVAKVGGA